MLLKLSAQQGADCATLGSMMSILLSSHGLFVLCLPDDVSGRFFTGKMGGPA